MRGFRSMGKLSFSMFGRSMKPVMVLNNPLINKRLKMGLFVGFSSLMLQKGIQMGAADLAQSTVISENHHSGCMVIIDIPESVQNDAKKFRDVLNALKKISEIPKDLKADTRREPDDELLPLVVGVGISTRLWETITKQLQKHHQPRVGKYGTMPHSNGNIAIHVKGETYSLCFEAVQQVLKRLPAGSFTVVHENYGFKYQDGRDLSGFLDGTMNPSSPNQREQIGINGKTGSSYLIHQIWRHDLPAIEKMPVSEQERLVGRVKPNSLELKNLDNISHVKRMRDEKGERMLIIRQSTPYGTNTGDHGLLFIAYSNSLEKFDTMLDRMVGIPDGHNDGIMKFSTCVFSNYYYIPSKKELAGL